MEENNKDQDRIHTKIWFEEAEDTNPFAAAECYVCGYNLYEDLVGKLSLTQYLFLLIKKNLPVPWEEKLFNDLCVAIANLGPRDRSIEAAMIGGAALSPNAASLISAIAAGSGNYLGSREVMLTMELIDECKEEIVLWQERLGTVLPYDEAVEKNGIDIWLPMEHPPGFDPHTDTCPKRLQVLLTHLAKHSQGSALSFVCRHLDVLQASAQCGLSITGIVALAFHDLKLSPCEGEMLFLLLRLPGAAIHSLEQREYGIDKFPLFRHGLKCVKPGTDEVVNKF